MTRYARTLLALLVMAVALPATAQVTDEDIDRARSEVNEIMAEAQALGDEVQEAWSRQFALDREITDLNDSIELARVKIGDTEQEAGRGGGRDVHGIVHRHIHAGSVLGE